MKRGMLVTVGGAAIVVIGLSGCSSNDSSSSSSESSPSSASESASATAAPGGTSVTIDGEQQDITADATCATMGGNVNIAIGEAMTGIAAIVSEGDSPTVTSVGLGNVNGVTLAVGPGAGDATAQKDGDTYTITGNATGIDMANPTSPVTKPFEIVVTCS